MILVFAKYLSLLTFIIATKIDLAVESSPVNLTTDQEITQMEDIIQTEQNEKHPPPPRLQVPVEVPNDEIIVEQEINLDAEINMDEPLTMPPLPKEDEEENFFIAVEQMPTLKNDFATLHQKLTYPEKAEKASIQGRIIIQFIVPEKGTVESPQVIRGIGGGCDEEALRGLN